MNQTKLYRILICILVPLVLLFFIGRHGVLWEEDWIYEELNEDQSPKSSINFSEVSRELNVELNHYRRVYGEESPLPKNAPIDRVHALGSIMPSVAIQDYDKDGFYDILVTDAYRHSGEQLLCLFRSKGHWSNLCSLP